MPKSLEPETTLTLDGKLLMGKCIKSKEDGNTWEICSYNPVTNIWKVEHELEGLTSWLTWHQSGIELKTFVKVYDEENKVLYFCGSLLQRVGAPCRKVFQFDLVRKAVKELPSLPESRYIYDKETKQPLKCIKRVQTQMVRHLRPVPSK